MYTASDIKKRIEEIKWKNAERQKTIIDQAVKKMYDEGLTSVEFSLTEGERLEYGARKFAENAGFECAYMGDNQFRLFIPEEE